MAARSLPFLVSAADAPGKQRILLGALRLFAQQGLEGTSIREIGLLAHTTNPALYKHFATKDALALHLFIVCYRELSQRLAAAVDAQEGFARRLAAFIDAFIAYHDEIPEAVQYISEHTQRFWPQVPPALARRSMTLQAQALIAQGRLEGAVGSGLAVPVQVLGVVGQLFQLARMIAHGLLEGPGARWQADLQRQIEQTLR